MPGSGAIKAGAAYVAVSEDHSALERGLKAAGKSMSAWGAQVTSIGGKLVGVGTAALAPLLGSAKVFADMGSQMNDMSARTGASVEALSTLGFAARQSGADVETLEGGLRKMAKTVAGAEEDSKKAAAALGELGIKVDDLKGKSPDEQFRILGQRLQGIKDPTQKAAAAMAIFGKSGTQLLPMMQGLKETERLARDLGLEMSTSAAAGADNLGDKLDQLWDVLKMGAFTIGGALAPALEAAIGLATTMIVQTTRWVKENQELVVTVAAVAAGIVAAGAALVVLGTVLTSAGAALGAIGAVIGAILSPIGLTVAAVGGLGYAFVTYTQTGKDALGSLSNKFSELKEFATSTFQGIADALSAGDIGLAAKILWNSVQTAWAKGTQTLMDYWTDFKSFTASIFVEIAGGISSAFILAGAEVEKALNRINGLATKAALAVTAIQKGMTVPDIVYSLIDQGVAGANSDIDKKAAADVDRGRANANGAHGELVDDAAKEKQARDAEIRALEAERDRLLAEAKEKRTTGNDKKRPPEEPPPPTSALEKAAKHAKETPGIGYEDARTAGGFKNIAAALRGGRDGAQEKSAELLDKIAGMTADMRRYQKETRNALVNTEVVKF